MLRIHRSLGALGATVTGLDLDRPLSAATLQALRRALAEHQVLGIHGQDISHAAHRDLGAGLGPLLRHPAYPTVPGYPDIMVLDNDREQPSKITEWHVDMSFTARPPLGSILVGRILPATGGDTLFASLAAAWDDLPAAMQERLAGLTATHSLAHGFRDSLAEPGGRERLQPALDANPDVVHPLVRRHPDSGRRVLYYSATFMRRINGVSESESTDLLAFLHRHTTQDKYVLRFRWAEQSIAFWDNRAVMHVPVNDYWPQRRRMERVTIEDAGAAA